MAGLSSPCKLMVDLGCDPVFRKLIVLSPIDWAVLPLTVHSPASFGGF